MRFEPEVMWRQTNHEHHMRTTSSCCRIITRVLHANLYYQGYCTLVDPYLDFVFCFTELKHSLSTSGGNKATHGRNRNSGVKKAFCLQAFLCQPKNVLQLLKGYLVMQLLSKRNNDWANMRWTCISVSLRHNCCSPCWILTREFGSIVTTVEYSYIDQIYQRRRCLHDYSIFEIFLYFKPTFCGFFCIVTLQSWQQIGNDGGMLLAKSRCRQTKMNDANQQLDSGRRVQVLPCVRNG